jgi:hypothetical protein
MKSPKTMSFNMSKSEDIDAEEHFKNWYNEIEAFSLRGERIYWDIMQAADQNKYDIIHSWIKSAYCIGFREGRDYENRKQKKS